MTNEELTVRDDFSPTRNLEIINKNSQDMLSKDIMLQSQSNHENGLKRNYHGRELLELLQNADDAYTALPDGLKSKDVQVLFELKKDGGQEILRISNHGRPFNASAVLSLCRGDASNKDDLFIGNKGIGFRSVLNWASIVRVYSGKYNIEFSAKNANENLEEIRKKTHIAELLEKHPKLEYPILWAPKEISSNVEPGYDTTIELVIKEGSQSDNWSLEKQIEEFDECTLLFIQSTNKITFKLPGTIFSFQKEVLENHEDTSRVSVYKLDGDDKVIGVKKEFIVFKSNDHKLEWGKEGEKYSVPMVVAIPTDFSPLRKKMYTFFPIANLNCPFNALMHTSFVLSDTRDSVNSDAVNEKVFELLLEFYVQKVCDYFQKKEYGNKILELLTPSESVCKNRSFPNPFDKKDGNGKTLFAKYIEKVNEKVTFLTVNDDFIGMENANADSPKRPILNEGYPSYFTGPEFESLVKKIDNSMAVDFAKSFLLTGIFWEEERGICAWRYRRDELVEKINKLSSTWTAAQNIEAFLWWRSSFPENTGIPKLLKEKSDSPNVKWIENGLFFLPSKDNFTEIPGFAKCSFLDEEYAEKLVEICEVKYGPAGDKSEWDEDSFNSSELAMGADEKNPYKEFREHEKRVIIQFLQKKLNINNSNYIEIKEYSASNLIRPINDAVQGNYKNAKDFAKWLRLNLEEIKKNKAWFNLASDFNVTTTYFPCRDGSVAQIKDLYQGREYGNDMGEELFSYVGSKKAVAGPEEFLLGDEDSVDDIKEFLDIFAVSTMPSVEMKTSYRFEDFNFEYQRYLKELISEHSKSIKSQNEIASQELEYVCIPEVKGIQEILRRCDTETILKWILTSEELRDAMKENAIGAEIRYKVHTKGYGKPPKAPPIKTFEGYLHFLFRTSSWLACKKGGVKRAPKDYIQLSRDRFKDVLNVISESDIRQISEDVGSDELTLKDLLVQFGVAQDFIELPVENFYNMMLDLPDKDPTGELSASVYLSCIRSLASNKDVLKKFDSDCFSRKRFMICGKLSAKQTTSSKEPPSFQSIKEVYFTNKAVPNISGKYLLNVPVKNGSLDDMKLLFGVQQFKEDILIDATRDPVNSDYDEDFQTELAAYMPYAYCLRVGKANEGEKSRLRRLEIHLAKSLYVQIEGLQSQPFTGDLYTIFQKSPTLWYIYIGNSKYDNFELSKKMEDIFEVLCNLQDRDLLAKYRELYSNKERRDSLIEYYGYSQEEINESKQFFRLCDSERGKVLRYLESIHFEKIEEAKERIKDVYLGKNDSVDEQLLLLQFLKFVGINLDVLNGIIGNELDVQLALRKLLKDSLEKLDEAVYCSIADSLCEKPLDEKKKIGKIFEEIEEVVRGCSKDIKEIATFDADAKIEEIVRAKVGKWSNDPGRYSRNNTRLLQEAGIDKESESQYISNLLYFNINWELGDADEVAKTLKEELRKQGESGVDDSPDGDGVPNDDLDGGPGDGGIPPSHWRPPQGGGFGGGDASNKGTGNKKIGDIGEKFIYDRIWEKSIKEVLAHVGDYDVDETHIDWVSGAAGRKKRVRPKDGFGYDIAVYGKDGRRLLIEVKTSTQRACSFYMTLNEKKKAEEEKNNYTVIFVYYDKANKKCEYWYIGNPWKDENINQFNHTETEYHIDYRDENEKG